MPYAFSAEEVLRIAERIERNGSAFYRRAAAATADEALRSKLLDLAQMEEGHQRTFAALRDGLAEPERKQATADPEGEAAGYLAALANSSVFDERLDPTQLVDEAATPADLLQTAIRLEKDSILFYIGLRDLLGHAARDRIEEILSEEVGHVALLRSELPTSC